MVNPMLVEEQIRGGVVQGLGAALFEEIMYGSDGELLTGTMAEYLVPMSARCRISLSITSAPRCLTPISVRRASSEAGTRASGAVLNAVDDALAPFGAQTHAVTIDARTPASSPRAHLMRGKHRMGMVVTFTPSGLARV